MAKKINTQTSFEAHYTELQLLVQQIEDDETPLEKLPKLIEDANAILKNLQIKLREIDSQIKIVTEEN